MYHKFDYKSQNLTFIVCTRWLIADLKKRIGQTT